MSVCMLYAIVVVVVVVVGQFVSREFIIIIYFICQVLHTKLTEKKHTKLEIGFLFRSLHKTIIWLFCYCVHMRANARPIHETHKIQNDILIEHIRIHDDFVFSKL